MLALALMGGATRGRLSQPLGGLGRRGGEAGTSASSKFHGGDGDSSVV